MEKHRLAVWLDGRISQVAFAERVKCSESFLSNVINGARRPSYDSAKRISEATGGEISVDAIFSEAARMKAKSAEPARTEAAE